MTMQSIAPLRTLQGITGKRRLLIVLLIFLVLAATLLSAGSALAQATQFNNTACWSIFTGGGAQRQATSNRVIDALTWSGGDIASSSLRIRNNHLATWSALNPPVVNAPSAPIINSTTLYLPLAMRGLFLQRLCQPFS